MAELTSHPISLFCPQGFTCRSRMTREYQAKGTAALCSSVHPDLPGYLVLPWGQPCPADAY